jgi:hypothetical protein
LENRRKKARGSRCREEKEERNQHHDCEGKSGRIGGRMTGRRKVSW